MLKAVAVRAYVSWLYFQVGDLECVHQGQDVEGECRLVDVAWGLAGQKGGRAVAAEVGHDHPVSLGGQQWRDLLVAVDVIGEAVHQDDWLAIGRAKIDVADVQHASVDLLHRREGRRRPCRG